MYLGIDAYTCLFTYKWDAFLFVFQMVESQMQAISS